MTLDAGVLLRLAVLTAPFAIVLVGLIHSSRRGNLPVLVVGLACIGLASRAVGWTATGPWEGLHFLCAFAVLALLPGLLLRELWCLARGPRLIPPLTRDQAVSYWVSFLVGVAGTWAAFSTTGRGIP